MNEPTKKTARKILTITTTVLWGLPAGYVFVAEVIMLTHAIESFGSSFPIEVLFPNFFFLAGSILVILAVIAQWGKNKTRRILGNVLFLVASLILVPIMMLAAAYGHSNYSWFVILLYPILGFLLSVLSLSFGD